MKLYKWCNKKDRKDSIKKWDTIRGPISFIVSLIILVGVAVNF
jgi:hypothetical protein